MQFYQKIGACLVLGGKVQIKMDHMYNVHKNYFFTFCYVFAASVHPCDIHILAHGGLKYFKGDFFSFVKFRNDRHVVIRLF